jgi:transposase
MGHVEGISRDQRILISPSLDERVGADHPIRVIDAFVESLDLGGLGFSKVVAAATGRPPYRPGALLKLYIYGYLNRIRSSRQLEREAVRNIEVQWLLDSLTPCFKTIADFRRDHAKAIVGVCRSFVRFCREQSLYGAELLAIDGTKIEAVASRKKVLTPKGLAKEIAALDRRIAEHLAAMNETDRQEASADRSPSVADALAALKDRRQALEDQAKALAEEGVNQKVIGESEARLMRLARGGHQVAYNAQTAVDAKHGLIAAFDVTNDGNDHGQLERMALAGRAELSAPAEPGTAPQPITVVADTGYSNGELGHACAEAGITAIVPRPQTVNPEGEYFSRDAFTYDATQDVWICPAGETLTRLSPSSEARARRYSTKVCAGCSLKPRCTEAKNRMIIRDRFEDAREAMHRRAIEDPSFMRRRRELAEAPFGTIKWMMGRAKFLVRGLEKAKAEFSMLVLAFNLKRAIAILGAQALIQRLQPAPW